MEDIWIGIYTGNIYLEALIFSMSVNTLNLNMFWLFNSLLDQNPQHDDDFHNKRCIFSRYFLA